MVAVSGSARNRSTQDSMPPSKPQRLSFYPAFGPVGNAGYSHFSAALAEPVVHTESPVHLVSPNATRSLRWSNALIVDVIVPPSSNNKLLYRDRLRERSEEHTSELQSHSDLVCRLLL